MGQQQLLLLVLGIVVVGVALVMGIAMMTEGKDNAEYDAITSEAMRVASDIVAWKSKPSSHGGGKDVAYLTGLDFDMLGYGATNKNGNKANTDLYVRRIGGAKSKRPNIMIRPKSNMNLRVHLFMYGSGANCFKLRRSKRVNGKWKNVKMKVGKNKPPAGCKVW